jgi:plastocyanin
MRLRGIVLSMLGIALVLLGSSAPASAGGCGEPASHGSGATVVIENACFTPSLLSVDPGATVTFVNRDTYAHNVGGQMWGRFEDLEMGQRFRATFRRDGIYPYACIIHPGMTGAIVVGDGVGPGNGRAVTIHPVGVQVADAAPPATAAAPSVPTNRSTVVWAVLIALMIGAAIGAGATWYRRPASLSRPSAHP